MSEIITTYRLASEGWMGWQIEQWAHPECNPDLEMLYMVLAGVTGVTLAIPVAVGESKK